MLYFDWLKLNKSLSVVLGDFLNAFAISIKASPTLFGFKIVWKVSLAPLAISEPSINFLIVSIAMFDSFSVFASINFVTGFANGVSSIKLEKF